MQSKSDMDVESLQKSGRCLDRCLLLSVIVLFAGLASLAAAGALVVNTFQSKIQALHAHPEAQMSHVIGNAYVNIFQNQNFAFLVDDASLLANRTLKWRMDTVGRNFELNSVQHNLKVKQSGSYFLYLELNLTCGTPSQTDLIRVQVMDVLSCDVHLTHSSCSQHQPTVHKCWAVKVLKPNTTLEFDMSLPHGLQSKPQLHRVSFGMFLVG